MLRSVAVAFLLQTPHTTHTVSGMGWRLPHRPSQLQIQVNQSVAS